MAGDTTESRPQESAKMLTDTTEITLVTEATVDAKHWAPGDENGKPRNAPTLLVSSASDAHQWSAFAATTAQSGDVYAVWSVGPYTLIQTIWAIGEPVSVIAHGKEAGNTALEAARFAKGAVRALALVDYGLDAGDVPAFDNTTCPLILVRGRQSEITDHQQIVAARASLGGKCKLVELENCGSRPANSCPQDFLAAIEWFLRPNSA
jgi:pimeloyl-ACP methyl ester carboxylesterase